MTDSPARRKTRTPLLLLGTAVVLVATTVTWFKALEYRRWKHLEMRVAQLRAEADARFCPRPVLRGTPVPGNAWDDYLPAIDLIPDFPEEDPGSEARRLEQNRYASAVEGMRRGTRRADLRWARLGERRPKGSDLESSWLGKILILAGLASDRAEVLFKEGKTRDAAELLLDVLKFSEDVAADGSEDALRLHIHITGNALTGIERLLTDERLPAQDCVQIARELGQLDATFPRVGPLLLGKLEHCGSWILEEGNLQDLVGCKASPDGIKAGWREAYSLRLMKISGFDQTDALISRLLSSDEGSASDEAARRKKVFEDLSDSGNVYFRIFAHPEDMPESGWFRTLRSELRQLRVAAHWRATGGVLELADTSGAKFPCEIEAGNLVLWVGGSRREFPRRP
jgi:hypothetical protein